MNVDDVDVDVVAADSSCQLVVDASAQALNGARTPGSAAFFCALGGDG